MIGLLITVFYGTSNCLLATFLFSTIIFMQFLLMLANSVADEVLG